MVRVLASDAARLLRLEIALLRAEVLGAVRLMKGGVARLAMGAGLAVLGLLALIAAIVLLLGELIGSHWLAALIVAALLLAIGGGLALSGTRRVRSFDPTPRASVASLRETAQWARSQVTRSSAPVREHVEAPAGRPALPGDEPGSRTRAAIPSRPSARPEVTAPSTAPVPGAARERPAATDPEERGGAAVKAGRAPRHPPSKSEGTFAFLKYVGRQIQEDEVPGHAAKLAYYAFMAMPPALMALFGLAGLIGSVPLASWLQEQAALALPAAVSESIIDPFIEQVVLRKAPGPFSIGLILALWGGSSMFVGLMETLNHAFDLEDTRSFMRKRATALATMVGSLVLFLVAAGSLLAGPVIVDFIDVGPAGELAWSILQWPLAFGFMVIAFWCGYYFLPDRDQSRCKLPLLRAAAIAAAFWVLATAAFRLYIANFSSYSETYGFLGAFIILLLWLYVTGLVVLAGGELASEMERRPA